MTTLPDMDGSQPCATGDPEAFFPTDARTEAYNVYLCLGCPYLAPCRAYALTHDVCGVWGGTSYEQRRAIRRRDSIRAHRVNGDLFVRTADAVHQRASRARRGGK